MFAKCFLSAVHSVEEGIIDTEMRYAITKLLALLHNNWKSFLDLANKNAQKRKKESEKLMATVKSLEAQLESEKRAYEERAKKERAKFEMKPLVQQYNLLKEKHHQLKINMENEKKEMSSQISLLKVNNGLLQEKIEKVEKDADVRRNAEIIQNLRTELHKIQEVLKNEKEDRTSIGYKLSTLLEATKKELREAEHALAEKTKESADWANRYARTKKELEDNRAAMKENLEKMAMTGEDILQVQLKMLQKDNRLGEKDVAIEELKKKVDELETQLKLQREGLVQQKEISIEDTLFYFVRENPLGKLNDLSKASSREVKQIPPNEFEERKLNTEIVAERAAETNDVRLETINTQKYTYLRPQYGAFIRDLLPTDEHESVTYSPPFPVWLHVTIRAIFDAKLNELLLSYNKGKIISRFPDFVYGWLGMFCIDKESRNVRLLEYTEMESMANESRRNLLFGLEAASAAKLWEISVFKEFLDETLTVDELVFFLHCRFLLFRGPQLAVPTAGFCVTHFVTKEKVFDTVEKVMYRYTPDERKTFKKKLLEFSRQAYHDTNAFDYAMVTTSSSLLGVADNAGVLQEGEEGEVRAP